MAQKAVDGDFVRRMVLGTGSFAKVIMVDKVNGSDKGKTYAMKVLNKKKILQQKQATHTMTERRVLGKTFDHPFIVSLKYAYQTKSTLNFVMDFCAGGELYYHMTRNGRFSLERSTFYTAELLLALEYLHSFNVVYRDLKPENVLVATDGHIKLADFGLSKEGIIDDCTGADTFCGTPEYLAPEILHRQAYGTAVDWWSLGMLTFEMLTGLPPWYSKNRQVMFQGICFGELQFPANGSVSSSAQDFISGLLIRDPRRRIEKVQNLKKHIFFSEMNFDDLVAKRISPPWIPERNKLYFDSLYTRLPYEDLIDQTLVVNELSTVSPLFPSSFVDKAFNGFSYTAPTSISTLNNQESKDDETASASRSCTPVESTVDDMHDDCFGQFNLELDENM